ncbi:right-handed parallel beta-helix repeat-containing protein [Nostocoides sp. HKS02]|uniref:right-handed parallel beta-helix repeat-containing protein n=1 Tax=Nostocoides sp. HKS02 TaxID=1813880 RepID=UPI0012B47F77|nr:right-handed parallel beta-helix repeat-containing protein [Tetrasphaera sp. HKS02]QGN59140.1 hypothetical protein GKE56_15985 [Tetrasphaera sp. HKS02]
MIRNNWIHHNWGVGGWADTNNANTTWTGNTITDNENGAIWEETSYNFSITDNYLARNNLTDGPGNPSFPMPAIYISESGSDTANGGVPRCAMESCVRSRMPSYPHRSVIGNNTLVDNGGGIFLWQNSNRRCNDGFDGACTLVKGGARGPFSMASCAANLPGATLDAATHRGNLAGQPRENYWDGCMWETQNVRITQNRIDFTPAHIPGCEKRAWPACGANGVFSQYGGTERPRPGLGGPHPDHVLPAQPLVRQRLHRSVDVLRLEPGKPREPRELVGVDRPGRQGRPVRLARRTAVGGLRRSLRSGQRQHLPPWPKRRDPGRWRRIMRGAATAGCRIEARGVRWAR